MIIVAVVLAVAGLTGLVVGLLARRRLRAMQGTATVDCTQVGDVAAAGEATPCEVVGNAEAAGEPLSAPLSGTPCVWFRTSVTRRYHDRDGDNDRDQIRTRVISRQESPAPFAIRDRSGVVTVQPEGASVIGESRTVSRFEPYYPGQSRGGGDSLTERAVGLGLSLLTQGDHDTIGYEYREWIIPEGTHLYVRAGAMRDHTGHAWLQKPARGPYLISTKSEAALTRRSRLTMLIATIAGAVALVAGLVLAAVALL